MLHTEQVMKRCRMLGRVNSDEELVRASLHEAGHSVVGHALGLPIGRAVVYGDGRGRSCVYKWGASQRRRITVHLAGSAAEQLVGFTDTRRVDEVDRSRAWAVARDAGYNAAMISRLRRRATRILELNVDALYAVADALFKHGELSSEEIDQLIEATNNDEADIIGSAGYGKHLGRLEDEQTSGF